MFSRRHMEFVEEDEVLETIYIREFLSVEKMLEYDPKFVQSSYNEIVELISELVKSNTRARVFADLHKSIINPSERILTDYTKFKVNVHRSILDDLQDHIDAYTNANNASYYNLQQTQKSQVSMPFNLDTVRELPNPVLDIPGTLILPSSHDSVQLTESDCSVDTSIPVDAIAWQPIRITDEAYLVDTPQNIRPSKFIQWKMHSDPDTLHEWIEKKLEPSFKTTLENHLQKHLQKIIKKSGTPGVHDDFLVNNHTIDSQLMHDGYKLEQLTEVEFNLLVSTLETLETTYNELVKETESKKSHTPKHAKNANIHTYNGLTNLSKYIVFWDFLGSFKFPQISDDYIIQLRERCGNYTMEHTTNIANEDSVRKSVPYNMAMNILNNTNTLEDLLEHIESYRQFITYNRIKNLLDDMPKTSIEQLDVEATLDMSSLTDDVSKLIQKFKQTTLSIIAEKSKPFLNTYTEIAEFVEGNDSSQYDGTPFISAQGTYDEDFEMGMVDDIVLALDPDAMQQTRVETGEEDAYELIISKYSEKYNELNESSPGTLEVLSVVLKQLINVRDATGIKWNEKHINTWIKNVNTNDLVKQRMSRAEQIKSKIPDISDRVLQQVCVSTKDLALARIRQISNSELATKLESIYGDIHTEYKQACDTTLISGLSAFWLDSLEASVKGYLGFNILSGMVNFVNTWSPYGVPLEKETKVGKRGIIYYIDAVSSYVLKNNVPYAEVIMKYVKKHYNERLEEILQNWKSSSSKPVQSKAEQSVVSLLELLNNLKAKKQVSRNTIINTFIKSFVYLPIQLPIEDWNKYKKLPAWDLGCCTAKLDSSYVADTDMKTSTKDLHKLKLQLARQRWNIEPRKKYALFIKRLDTRKSSSSKDGAKDSSKRKEPESITKTSCITYYKPDEIVEKLLEQHDANIYNFIFEHTWFPNTYVSNMVQDPKLSNLYAQNIISKCINSSKANDINSIVVGIKDISSIVTIINLLIKNLFAVSTKYKKDSDIIAYNIYNDALQTAQEMKNVLIKMQNTFKGTHYTNAVYFSKYILALAYSLPAQVIYVDKETQLYVPDGIDIDIILHENYKLVNAWKHTFKMPTVGEFNDYINTMREESKNKTMATYNVLSDDDLQLMKDTKRFGLKVDQPVEVNPDGNANNTQDYTNDSVQDYSGEREFYPESGDADVAYDEKL